MKTKTKEKIQSDSDDRPAVDVADFFEPGLRYDPERVDHILMLAPGATREAAKAGKMLDCAPSPHHSHFDIATNSVVAWARAIDPPALRDPWRVSMVRRRVELRAFVTNMVEEFRTKVVELGVKYAWEAGINVKDWDQLADWANARIKSFQEDPRE